MITDAKPSASDGTVTKAFDHGPSDLAAPRAARMQPLLSGPAAGAVAAQDPEPGIVASGQDSRPGEHTPTVLSWLGEAVIDGLAQCACLYHPVHPDLLTGASGETPSVLPSREVVDDDAD